MNVTQTGIKEDRIHSCDCGYHQRDNAEHEGYDGASTRRGITENNSTNADNRQNRLLEEILSAENLNQAYKQVKKNKGAHGVDGMETEHLLRYLKENGENLRESILQGSYKPNPVRRVEIPKENGKKRKLGIPTVVDRVIQQAIAQKLTLIFEPQFSETSYGFRPRRSQHDALRKCQEYANEGYTYVADMDLEKFFDTVNQSKMIEILSRTIRDERVISLIHKYLRAGAEQKGRYEETTEGLVQGGNISPICSNIMLNELDKELDRRGIRYVRFADDVLMFAKSKRSAMRIMEHIIPFIERKLRLKVNREKTEVAYIGKIKYLGYGFYQTKRGVQFRVHKKSVEKMKQKVREITSRSKGIGFEAVKKRLKETVNGWVNYFKLADMKMLTSNTDSWLRRRIRMYYWKQWKRVRTRYKELKRLGMGHTQAIKGANSRKSYWRMALSPVLTSTLTDDMIRKEGFQLFYDYYKTVVRV